MYRVIQSCVQPIQLSNIFCSKDNRGPSNCIDVSSTGMSYYDTFLDSKYTDYLKTQKNLEGHIEQLTPQEYYEGCAHIFGCSVESLIQQRRRDSKSMEWLSERLDSGQKFHLPFINYAANGQEGLHRMLVLADKYGWDKYTFPVLIVNYADPRRAEVNVARKALDSAISESVQYRYFEGSLPDSLIDQIQSELESNEDNSYTAKCLKETSDTYVISLVGFESDIALETYKSDIRTQSIDDFEIDDLEFDDIDWDNIDLDTLLKS